MEAAIKTLLESSVQYCPGYLIAALALILYCMSHKDLSKERSDHAKTSEKLIELSTASIRADMEHTSAIETLSRILDNIERRLK